MRLAFAHLCVYHMGVDSTKNRLSVYLTAQEVLATRSLAIEFWSDWSTQAAPRIRRLLSCRSILDLGGGLRAGTFWGPRRSEHPQMCHRQVIELDGRLYLPNGMDATQLVSELQAATELTGTVKSIDTKLWTSEKVPRILLYGWFEKSGYCMELELACLERKHLLGADPATYWQAIYSGAELAWTGQTRHLMRQNNIPEYVHGGVYDLKKAQVAIAQWRIVAGFSTGYFAAPVPGPIRPRMNEWWHYPEPTLPKLCMEIPEKPAPPAWVRNCHQVASCLRTSLPGEI